MSKLESKEEYLKFISAWKSATNAEECKSKRIVCDHIQYNWNGFTDEEKARLEDKGYTVTRHSCNMPNGGHCKEPGWLRAEHYIFRNVMLGKDLKRGFSPKTNHKMQYGETPYFALERAVWNLEYVIESSRRYIEQTGLGKNFINSRDADRVKEFLRPFGNKIKPLDLLKINKEDLEVVRIITNLTRK